MAPASRMTARVMIVDLILVVSVSPVIPRDECGQGIPRMTSEFRSKFVVVSTWVRPGKWGCGAIQHWHVECSISEGEMQERRAICVGWKQKYHQSCCTNSFRSNSNGAWPAIIPMTESGVVPQIEYPSVLLFLPDDGRPIGGL